MNSSFNKSTSSSSSSSNSSNSNLDHLFLQTLISRLQIRPPNPLHPRTLDDLLLDAISNLSDSDNDADKIQDEENNDDFSSNKSRLAKEESKLEKQLIRLIRAGDVQTLKPNSGQAVSIGEHHICVGNHVESGSDYKVWEWHGHIMLFDEDNGYTPEYIYGNYFERLTVKQQQQNNNKGKMKKEQQQQQQQEKVVEKEKKVVEVEEEKVPVNLGLKDLIGGGEPGGARVVHRGLNPIR